MAEQKKEKGENGIENKMNKLVRNLNILNVR